MTSDPIRTGDGSFTLRHPELGEPYHAREGARGEALLKFIRPTRLADRLLQGPVRLLDIGFGLGVNCAAALECAGGHFLHIDALELEPEALERGQTLDPESRLLATLRDCGTYEIPGGRVALHLGDLRRTLPTLEGPYDIVFHDPFSPLKNTECWTVELFRRIRDRMRPDGVLATYSESIVVRAGLREAGLHVAPSPAFPPYRGGTLASPSPDMIGVPLPPLDTVPYSDPDLTDDARDIRSRREAEVRARARR